MYYALTFQSVDDDSIVYNTYDDWKIVPSSRPLIEAPKVNTKYVSTNAVNGSIDLTTVLSSRPTYQTRTGSWTFYVLNSLFDDDNYDEWFVRYETIMQAIHGKKFKVFLEDDTEYYYICRLSVKEWKSPKDYSQITINYVADPYKLPINTETSTMDWKWRELFGNIIYYGQFHVTTSKKRNLINPEDIPKSVDIYTTTGTTVIFDSGESYALGVGATADAFEIQPGDNKMEFVSGGDVTVSYERGPSL